MAHSRHILLASALVVAIGSTLALSALLLGGAPVGPLPAEALSLPAETRFLVGIDVKRVVKSPLFKRYASSAPAVFAELKARTGLDPERDLDRIVVTSASENVSSGLVLAFGQVGSEKISKALGPRKDLYRKELGGETLFTYSDAAGTKLAVVLLSDHALLVGGEEACRRVLESAKSGATPLKSNAALITLVSRLRAGATVWMVGDQTLLSALPRAMPGAGGGGAPALNLPAMKSLMGTLDLDPEIVFELEAEAPDPASAKNLGDIVRGFLALATLQAAQKPELQKLATAIGVTNDQNRVLVNGRLPYDLIDSLQGAAGGPRPSPPHP